MNMNTVVRKEIEDLIVSGRNKTEEEFDRILDEYIQDKTEEDKKELGEALVDFFADRIGQLLKIDNKLAMNGKHKEMKEPFNVVEMALVLCEA